VLCDVVVENQGGEDTTSLIAQLGETLEPTVLNQNHHKSQRQPQPLTSSYEVDNTSWDPSKREELEHRLSQLTEEMMRTERSYVSRIAALQKVRRGVYNMTECCEGTRSITTLEFTLDHHANIITVLCRPTPLLR